MDGAGGGHAGCGSGRKQRLVGRVSGDGWGRGRACRLWVR